MYESTTDFRKIVDVAMKIVNEAHLLTFFHKKRSKVNFIIRDRRTVIEWFYDFRNNDCFNNPAVILKHKKTQLPPLLDNNPGIVKEMLEFCRANIDGLNVDMVNEFLLKECLPKLAEKIRLEQNSCNYNLQNLLSKYNLTTLTIKTVRNWKTTLGFKFEPCKKSYYVDTHETAENIEYRSKYIDKYFEYKFRAHRWFLLQKIKEMQ